MSFAVLLDSCVLYPRLLRDLLLRLVEEDKAYRIYFSHKILDAVSRNLVKNTTLDERQAAYLKNQVLKAFPEALVEDIPDGLEGILKNDPGDRHVLASAIKASTAIEKMDWIVTFNLKDFKDADLSPWGIKAISPDDFLLELCDEYSVDRLIQRLEAVASGLPRPISFLDLAKKLEKQCPNFISRVLLDRYGPQICESLEVILRSGVAGNSANRSPWLTKTYKISRTKRFIRVCRKEGDCEILQANTHGEIKGMLSCHDVERFLDSQVHDVVERLKFGMEFSSFVNRLSSF